jgi:hypothetical protein
MKLGYPAEEVHALERELLPHLPHAHIRIAKSLALILYYAQAVASLAQAPEDLKGYVIETICAVANDPDESGDSLRDFFEKVFELQSRSSWETGTSAGSTKRKAPKFWQSTCRESGRRSMPSSSQVTTAKSSSHC